MHFSSVCCKTECECRTNVRAKTNFSDRSEEIRESSQFPCFAINEVQYELAVIPHRLTINLPLVRAQAAISLPLQRP